MHKCTDKNITTGGGRQRAHSLENVPCERVTSLDPIDSEYKPGGGREFCPDDPQINAILTRLHDDLRLGIESSQLEIDRYLFAALPGPSAFGRLPRRFFVLLPWMVPTAESLPDIVPMIVATLSTTNLGDASPRAQLLRQCVPLKRRTKRAQREIVWTEAATHEMRVLLRCALGMLLGLYPACYKTVDFHNRVAIHALVHTLLVAPPALLVEFFNTMSYMLRLAIMVLPSLAL